MAASHAVAQDTTSCEEGLANDWPSFAPLIVPRRRISDADLELQGTRQRHATTCCHRLLHPIELNVTARKGRRCVLRRQPCQPQDTTIRSFPDLRRPLRRIATHRSQTIEVHLQIARPTPPRPGVRP